MGGHCKENDMNYRGNSEKAAELSVAFNQLSHINIFYEVHF